jgi:hypothetical protein
MRETVCETETLIVDCDCVTTSNGRPHEGSASESSANEAGRRILQATQYSDDIVGKPLLSSERYSALQSSSSPNDNELLRLNFQTED